MFHFRFIGRQGFLAIALLAGTLFACPSGVGAQTQRSPSDTVREFYRAMRAHRFRDAFALTIYKPAVESLTADEMEDLRPSFEEKAGKVPEQVEITGEQISGKIATVFVKIPVNEETPQVTSEPVALISSGGVWIIGTEADQAIVKKAGRRFFLDALIEGNQGTMEDLLKRLVGVEIAYSLQHDGRFADLPGLIKEGLLSNDVLDPAATGYNVHLTVAGDGKAYVAGGEPLRHGRTGKLSFWMDQTGAIKSADNGGKPLSAPK